MNPADYASRGLNAEEFLRNNIWINGPKFLADLPKHWPNQPVELTVSSDDSELKRKVFEVHATVAGQFDATSTLLNYFSTWSKLRTAVAWILKLNSLLAQCVLKRKGALKTSKAGSMSLSVQDIEEAEEAIVKFCQSQGFPQEMASLHNGKSVDRKSSIFKLDPVLDRGILRVGGRLSKMAMPEEQKHPAILPKGHHVSKLLLRHIHQQVEICMCRAVHLEVAHTMDTDSCVNAFRRFITRRGEVKELRSDNGTNLISAEKEFREALKSWNIEQIERSLIQKGVKWTFNPPAGAHHGGIWEHIIRMVKKILSSIMNEQSLDDEGLTTLMCEAESILNSRPLTTVSDDPNDLEPLTPNHLLQLKVQPVLPPGIFRREDLYARRRWRQIQYIADLFWTRWIQEYIPLMQERPKWSRIRPNFCVGDIVVVADHTAS
ncbi:hypothetical protein SRHO_G00336070 [Serrasalmus rhombeus]